MPYSDASDASVFKARGLIQERDLRSSSSHHRKHHQYEFHLDGIGRTYSLCFSKSYDSRRYQFLRQPTFK